MPLTDETFVSDTINVQEFERDVDAGVHPHIELQFMGGNAMNGVVLPTGQPDPLYVKKTKLNPSAAIAIGKAMMEAGERLAASASIEAVRSNISVPRNGTHP